MTTLIRRGSFELPALNRAFSQFFNEPFCGEAASLATTLEEGALPLDVSEDDKTVIVRASLPGFTKEDVNVEVHDGVLTIKAEHTDVREEKAEKFYRKERRTGSLSRRVALPSTVVEAETRAELSEGVLTLRIPKSQRAMPKKIAIN